MKSNLLHSVLVVATLLGTTSCEKEEVSQIGDGPLKNDLLKKTVAPAVAGTRIEFVYALGTLEGTLQSARAEASIAGGAGTGFSRFSWYTNRTTGIDEARVSATDTITTGQVSSAKITDTENKALSLRYYYTVPEEAKGQNISFKFSGASSTGQEASFNSGSYYVSKMDMKRLIALKDAEKCYVSIADMTAYTKEEVEQKNLSGKIDFVYIYRPTMGTGNFAFGHALVGLANPNYLKDLAVPAAWTKPATLFDKRIDVKDAQLRGTPGFEVFIDDSDLEQTTFTNAPDYAYGLTADQGAFVKTADGAYAAYVYVNSVNNTARTMNISIKRLKL